MLEMKGTEKSGKGFPEYNTGRKKRRERPKRGFSEKRDTLGGK